MDIMASSYDHFYFPPSSYLLSSLGRFLWLSEKNNLKQLFFLLFKIDVILYYYGLKTNAKQYGTFLAFLNHFQLKYLVSINSIYKVKSWLPTGAAERAFFRWSTKNFPFHTFQDAKNFSVVKPLNSGEAVASPASPVPPPLITYF